MPDDPFTFALMPNTPQPSGTINWSIGWQDGIDLKWDLVSPATGPEMPLSPDAFTPSGTVNMSIVRPPSPPTGRETETKQENVAPTVEPAIPLSGSAVFELKQVAGGIEVAGTVTGPTEIKPATVECADTLAPVWAFIEKTLDAHEIEPCMCGWTIECEPEGGIDKWKAKTLKNGDLVARVTYIAICRSPFTGTLFD
ncbi:MAG: hypothetical protein KGL39_26660 [Patescibacteria group bacterium]|nr:hypothetical protein [Patescibacteria group bacterium]